MNAVVYTVIGVVALVSALLTLLVALWGSRQLVRRWKEARDFDRSWPRVIATVTADGVDLNYGFGVAKTSYTFTLADGRTFVGGDYERVFANRSVGSQAEVMYNPDDPRENHPAGKMGRRIGVWAAMFIPLLLVLYALVGFFVYMSFDCFRDM